MTRKNIIAGLTILEKYDPDGYICAEHDIIYDLDKPGGTGVSEEDRATLGNLGWLCDEDGWTAFT